MSKDGKSNYKSAATLRMESYYKKNDFHCEFNYSPAYGLGPEDGITRRDPSSVIYYNGEYHVWYTRTVGDTFGFESGSPYAKTWSWDLADIWHASSVDGVIWKEDSVAVKRGARGAYDDRSVFTPEILYHNHMFYMVYQVVKHPYLRASYEYIAMAWSDSPYGPWEKSDRPIFEPSMPEGVEIDRDNPLNNEKTGLFDDLRVHDPCLFFREGQYWLYYKGVHAGMEWNLGGRDVRWGVAMADKPQGPYERSKYNPITNTGHETLLWEYNGGMVALLTKDGPEANTIQYAEDGVNFEIRAAIENTPEAAGPFRCKQTDEAPLAGLRWGLCHEINTKYGYIKRFDTNQTDKIKFNKRYIPF